MAKAGQGMHYFPNKKWVYTIYRRSDGYLGWERRSYEMTVEMLNRIGVDGQTFEIICFSTSIEVAQEMTRGPVAT
jgi:hypothetical protein